MATEILQKARSAITAQANTPALTADEDLNSGSYTGATPATLDNRVSAAAGQPKGAFMLRLILDVTTAPATAAGAQIWIRESNDDSIWTRWRYSHTVPATILTSADTYSAGLVALTTDYTEIAVMAIDYGFNATLYATPILPGESQ